MSGSSLPKRHHHVDLHDVQIEEARSSAYKRSRMQVPLPNVPSRSGSPASATNSVGSCPASNTISSDESRKVMVAFDVGRSQEREHFHNKMTTVPQSQGVSLPRMPSQMRVSGDGLSYPPASHPEELCFGMLRDVEIRIDRALDKHALSFHELYGTAGVVFARLELVIEDERCDIFTKGSHFATMNRRTHLAVLSLSRKVNVTYMAVVPQQELQQRLAAGKVSLGTGSPSLGCKIALLIFGFRTVGDTVAKELSRFELFLQHPDPLPPHSIYENPQYLSIVGSLFGNGAVLPPISVSEPEESMERPGDADEKGETDLRTLLDNLPRQDYIGYIDVDERIRTRLLEHQREATAFIVSRETDADKSGSLWRLESFISEAPIYKHVITGFKTNKAEDLRGGILADGMGLGKTLSMIAGIASSIDRAEASVLLPAPSDSGSGTPLTPVKTTLIIVPSILLLDGWIEEISKHVTPGTLAYYKYHGPNRVLPLSGDLRYHLVFSTYGTVAADFKRGGGVLSTFHWFRLVLDEAHLVRSRSTLQYKAVASLSAVHRWCLTGTPVQNSLDDLASLISFLRVPLLEDAAVFQRHIAAKYGKRTVTDGIPKPKYGNLRKLLGSICLRRSTRTVLSSLGVAFTELRPRFSDAERQAYDELAIACENAIKAAVNGRPTESKHKSILTGVLRLRIFCNTALARPIGTGLTDNKEEQLLPDEVISLLYQGGEAICSNCRTEIMFPRTDGEFYRQAVTPRRQLRCPLCFQEDFTEEDDGAAASSLAGLPTSFTPENDAMQDIQFHGQQATAPGTDNAAELRPCPSKILALLGNIKQYYEQDKSIVFSFWRRSLDVVGEVFSKEGIVFCRIDGGCHPSQRKKIMADFHENPSTRVLLMTIGTGAVGLNNLSVASRVHILEPQWNPYVEDQAIGRVFRMGQSKNVCVIRYIMETTVEESIESRQMSKVQLALRSGLQSSDQELSESQRRVNSLQTLGKIIHSTILRRSVGRAHIEP